MKNKFGSILTESYKEYEHLSIVYDIPHTEIIQIDMNRCGVFLKNNEVRENFRVRFKGKIYGDFESWFALPVMAKEDTPFMIGDGKIYFKDIEIGIATTELILDTCESSYQRGPNLLNLNSRSRSNCAGCKACIHNYHSFYDSTVLKDKKQLKTKEDIIEFFEEKKLDIASLKQIAVVTGLFGSEQNVVDHMKLINEVVSERGFSGELMYFGCEVNSDEALEELSKLSNFKLIYAIDNFTRREKILSGKKSVISLNMAKDTLIRAKNKGIKTTISYIDGIDDLDTLDDGFKFLADSFTDFPIINIYQIQTQEQASILYEDGAELKYYLESRKIVENIFIKTGLEPKRWSNYRPLWYRYYGRKELPNNSFGQLE